MADTAVNTQGQTTGVNSKILSIDNFKLAFGLDNIPLSKTKNGRLGGSFIDPKTRDYVSILSRSDLDTSKNMILIENNILAVPETGEIVKNLWWLSNSKQEVALTL